MPTHYQIIVTHLRAVVLAVATIAASLTLPVLALAQAAPLSAPVTTEATLIHLPTFRIVAETIRDDIVQDLLCPPSKACRFSPAKSPL